MNKETENWTKEIIKIINELKNQYATYKGLILTEGDLECQLYKLLTNSELFSGFEETKTKNWKSGFVHSQVTWFKPGVDSGFRVDLTICEPKNIKIDNFEMVEDYPNKGFFHDGKAIALELKFIRDSRPNKISNDAQEDYVKIIKKLKIAKDLLIEQGRYSNVTEEDLAYICLIVCKSKEIYDIALEKLNNAISKNYYPKNVFPIIFHHTEIKEYNVIS